MAIMLVLGATSDIAQASSLSLAKLGWDLFLAGRDMERLETIATDIHIRSGATVRCFHLDVLDAESVSSFWNSLPEEPGGVLCAIGFLGDQEKARQSPELAEVIVRSNFSGLLPIISQAANAFEANKCGVIIGISSVAGDRGRSSNYIYGSAKAAFTAFLSGLRARLFSSGVQVITVKPGFVATRMTEKLNLPGLLTAEPEQVAIDICKAIEKKRDVVYSCWFWRWIMVIICSLPEFLFKRIKI